MKTGAAYAVRGGLRGNLGSFFDAPDGGASVGAPDDFAARLGLVLEKRIDEMQRAQVPLGYHVTTLALALGFVDETQAWVEQVKRRERVSFRPARPVGSGREAACC